MSKIDQLREMRESNASAPIAKPARKTKPVKQIRKRTAKTITAKLVALGKSVPLAAWDGFQQVSGRRAGRPRLGSEASTLAATKPWEKLGMSRRSWFRRQKEQQTKD